MTLAAISEIIIQNIREFQNHFIWGQEGNSQQAITCK